MTRNVLPPTIARLKTMGVAGVDVTCRDLSPFGGGRLRHDRATGRNVLSRHCKASPVPVRGVRIAADDPDAGLARDESVAGNGQIKQESAVC